MNTTSAVLAFLLLLPITPVDGQVATCKAAREGSIMTYRLVHPLHKIEATSKGVDYTVDLDRARKEIVRVSGVVDVTTFDSGNSNRDSHAMEVIDALTFPEARFVSTGILQHGDSITVNGKLTFHGVTKDIQANARTQWSERQLVVAGGFEATLTGFNIERPSLLLIPVEDRLAFTFTVTVVLN
jgi:polyisoprenoid-binding protein YceI